MKLECLHTYKTPDHICLGLLRYWFLNQNQNHNSTWKPMQLKPQFLESEIWFLHSDLHYMMYMWQQQWCINITNIHDEDVTALFQPSCAGFHIPSWATLHTLLVSRYVVGNMKLESYNTAKVTVAAATDRSIHDNVIPAAAAMSN